MFRVGQKSTVGLGMCHKECGQGRLNYLGEVVRVDNCPDESRLFRSGFGRFATRDD